MTQFRNMSPTQSCVRVTQQMTAANGIVGGSSANGPTGEPQQQGTTGSTSSSNGFANFLEQLEGNNQGNGFIVLK